jgi:hypothetical protein
LLVTDGELPNPPLAVDDSARLERMRGSLGASVQGLLVIYCTPIDPEHPSYMTSVQGLLVIYLTLIDAEHAS